MWNNINQDLSVRSSFAAKKTTIFIKKLFLKRITNKLNRFEPVGLSHLNEYECLVNLNFQDTIYSV